MGLASSVGSRRRLRWMTRVFTPLAIHQATGSRHLKLRGIKPTHPPIAPNCLLQNTRIQLRERETTAGGGFPAVSTAAEDRKGGSNMMSSSDSEGGSSGRSEDAAVENGWEMRPGGMLVQRRGADPETPAPKGVRLRISYGAARYEVSVGSQATFGQLKKLLSAETGLHPSEQRLLYKGKERGNGEFLDVCGVKDRSKLILVEDPSSLERRYLEMKKHARIQSTQRALSAVSLEVDKLAGQVSTIETSIFNGNKVAEVQITTLTEMLMSQAVKLDRFPTEGDTSSQKSLQAKRVQKCVETLDALENLNARVKPVVVTTKWETFEPQTTTKWEFFE